MMGVKRLLSLAVQSCLWDWIYWQLEIVLQTVSHKSTALQYLSQHVTHPSVQVSANWYYQNTIAMPCML